jgi:hypothetical protein
MINKCANCANCLPLYKHPSNKTIGRGSIMGIMGFICMTLDDGTHPVFMDNNLGKCENWEERKETP